MARQIWPPPVTLVDYNGPYPKQQLEEARRILIRSLTHPVSDLLDQLKPRLGLDSFRHGLAQKPPAVRKPPELVVDAQQQNVQPTATPVNVNNFLGHVGSINIVQSGRTSVSPVASRTSYSRSNLHMLTSPSADTSLNDSSYHLDTLFHESPDKGYVTSAQPPVSPVNASLSKGNNVVIDLTQGDENDQHRVTRTNSKRALDVVESASNKKLKAGSSQQEVNASQSAAPDAAGVNTSPDCMSHTSGSSQDGNKAVMASSSKESLSSSSDESQDETSVPASSSKDGNASASTSSSKSIQKTPLSTVARSPMAAASTKSTTSKPEGSTTFTIYKCDFCAYMNRIWLVMNEHLANAQHFSASLYNATFDNNSVKLVSIKHMVAIMNEHSKSKGLVVACPVCQDVFEDIFMCSLHYKYTHDSDDSDDTSGGYYTICPVIQHETVTMSRMPVCLKCSQKYESHTKLHKHWGNRHHPLTAPPAGDRIFTIYNCPYCNKMFCDFVVCKTHALTHKSGGDQQNGVVAIEVRHLLQPKRQEQLLPLDTDDSNIEGIKAELSILVNMRRYLKTLSGIRFMKMKKRKIKERIRCLREIVKMYGSEAHGGHGVEGNSKYVIRNTK